MIAGIAWLALTAAAPSFAANATVSVDAKPTAVLDVDTARVDIEVEGWAKKRVDVDGDLPAGWTVQLDGSGARIEVAIVGPGPAPSGTLHIKMPKAAQLHARTNTGDVTAKALAGTAVVATVTGDVRLGGSPTRVVAATTTGSIAIDGARGRLDVTTVGGSVRLGAPAGEVRIEAVSGGVDIRDARLSQMEINTVNGTVTVAARLTKGPHVIAVHSGSVRVEVPRKQALDFRAQTFSGTIEDTLASPHKTTRGTYRVAVGRGGPRLSISTFSGAIALAPSP